MKNFTTRLSQIVIALAIAMCPATMWALNGDVDGDGAVTSADVTALYNFLLNNDSSSIANGDVDGDGNITSADVTYVYNILLGITPSVDNQLELFNRCYASLRSEEPIEGYDPSHTSFLRSMWQMNTLTTDEAYCTWSDYGIKEMNTNSWGSDLPQAEGLYVRLCTNIDLCNTYLADSLMHDDMHNAEIRTLRAIYHYYLMDFFGNVPINTNHRQKTLRAVQENRTDVYTFALNEIIECCEQLGEPFTVPYGRIDQIAAAMMFARLYLNMSTYVKNLSSFEETLSYNIAKLYAQYVMNSAYGFSEGGGGGLSDYQSIFAADNGTNSARNEIILPIPFSSDDVGDYAWSGTTFIIAGGYGSSYESIFQSGLNTQWSGIIARPNFANFFSVNTQQNTNTAPGTVANALGDKRALFIYSNPSAINYITENSSYYDGLCYFKFSNRPTTGEVPSSTFAATDFPLIRYAEAPLTYAEADARLNSGNCTNPGVAALNQVRSRAGLSPVTSANLNTILDEWVREFGFEGRRRTELVRFNKYGIEKGGKSDYDWNMKGGSVSGRDFDKSKNVFAIPAGVMAQNPGYIQNPGYDENYAPLILSTQLRVDPEGYTISVSASWNGITNDEYIIYPNYELQFCADENFAQGTYITVNVGSETTYYPTEAELKRYIQRLGTPILKVRVHGTASGTGETYSNIKTLLLNYPTNQFDDIWWLTGSCIGDGNWNNSDDPTNCPSMAPMFPNGNKLEYAGYFPSGSMFFILSTPGDWNKIISGGNENGGQSYFAEYASEPITISTEGYYKIVLNPNTHQVTWTRLTNVNSFNSIGIIGYFSDWATDVDMNMLDYVYDVECHNWKLPFTLENNSELKFRPNHSWDYNWGTDAFPIGNGYQDGQNIPATAGTYTVYFNDILGDYIFYSE